MTVMVFDTETTGLGKTDEVIELAIIRCGDAPERVVLHARYRPRVPISNEARAIHGIENSELASLPTIDTDRDDIIKLLEHDADLVVGHNVRFDLRMLSQSLDYYLVPRAIVDTRELAERIDPDQPADLGSVYSRIVGSGAGPNHSALQDARATLEIWRALSRERGVGAVLIESQLRRMVHDVLHECDDTYTARHALLASLEALSIGYFAWTRDEVARARDLIWSTVRDDEEEDHNG